MLMNDYIPDPLEIGEMQADRYADRINGNQYTCSCGKTCLLDEVECISSNPYAEPFCPACLAKFYEKQK